MRSGRVGSSVGHAPPEHALRQARILVVDDVASNVTLLRRLLMSAGAAEVAGLTDPREVAAFCRSWQPDLILLDLHMPHMDGVAVLAALQEVLPDDSFVPTLMLTADVTAEAKEQALLAGAKDFVTKPFDRSEVILRVGNLLETRALYVRLQQHHALLQAQLDERLADERRRSDQRRIQAERILEVMRGDVMSMVFQPICALDGGAVVGVEALARFDRFPHRPPNEWFAEADDVGLGGQLEQLAVDRAVAQFGMLDTECFMAVNVSAATAMSEGLKELLAVVPGHRVVLEITEHVHVDDYESLLAGLDDLRRQGVRIAVDDAGVGYAGLQQILQLKPDIIKLDLDMTRGVQGDPARRALAASMVSFAADLGAVLLAEGIETQQDLDALGELGVEWGQGFHLARPAPLTDMTGSPLWAEPV